MATKSKSHVQRRIVGTILTIFGAAALVYAGYSQFAPDGDRTAAAGILLFSLVVLFFGIGQLYKKDADEY